MRMRNTTHSIKLKNHPFYRSLKKRNLLLLKSIRIASPTNNLIVSLYQNIQILDIINYAYTYLDMEYYYVRSKNTYVI